MNTSSEILIIDDNLKLCRSLAGSFQDRHHSCCWAVTREEALGLFRSREIGVVLLDIRFGEDNGIDILRFLKGLKPEVPVIMITAYGTVDSAVAALKLGAFDYIQKPVQFEQLLKQVGNAIRVASLEAENRSLYSLLQKQSPRLVTSNARMLALCETAKRIASSELPVLICGETGTGKELLAEMIHAHSPRANREMLKINCAAFTESLLDNELFGHEKGSFTGATGTFKGIFEKASKGAIFLDELSTMTLATQAKILRTIQNQEIRRIGGNETITIDVRFITATNENLDDLMRRDLFRKDLYYRLNSAILRIPSLRDRLDDIPPLVDAFLDSLSDGSPRRQTVSPRVLEAFAAYDWPGNVRELRGVIQYAAAVSTDGCIDVDDLPPAFHSAHRANPDVDIRSASERNLILRILRETGFNKKRAAEVLSMSRATLYSKLEKYGIGHRPG